MRREIIECDGCGAELNLDRIKLITMSVTDSKDELVLASEGHRPDFCGVPCMLKWINSKLTGGTSGNKSE